MQGISNLAPCWDHLRCFRQLQCLVSTLRFWCGWPGAWPGYLGVLEVPEAAEWVFSQGERTPGIMCRSFKETDWILWGKKNNELFFWGLLNEMVRPQSGKACKWRSNSVTVSWERSGPITRVPFPLARPQCHPPTCTLTFAWPHALWTVCWSILGWSPCVAPDPHQLISWAVLHVCFSVAFHVLTIKRRGSTRCILRSFPDLRFLNFNQVKI